MRKHQVIFYSPGTFVSESSSYDIDSWDMVKAVELSEKVSERYGAKPYGFIFETLLTAEDVPDGEGGSLKVHAKVTDKSGLHFLGGRLETYSEIVGRNDDKENILRSNMRNNESWIICINDNSFRSTIPFGENDCIVNARGWVVQRGDDPKFVAYRAEQLTKRKSESGY